jgi:large subunit ribosomal protein L21
MRTPAGSARDRRLHFSGGRKPAFHVRNAMTYAIISIGGKQHRVREGERLLVDRLPQEEGATLEPDVLVLGGNGSTDLAPKGAQVTAVVVGHVLGKKIRIGKYRPKSGYRRHTGHRSRLTEIRIETIGSARSGKPDDSGKEESE